jgi:hypothetical protein
MRKSSRIRLILYPPETPQGKEELARQVADIHAEAVIRRLKTLSCPADQKQALLDALIRTVREETGEQA